MQIGILLLILLGWVLGTMAAEVPAVAQNKAPALPQAAEKTITGDELTATAIAAVNQALEGKTGIDAKVEIVHLPPPLKVSGEYTLVAESVGNIIQPGVRTVQIQVQRGNRIMASTSVNVRIRLFQSLPVAAGASQANETLSAADVDYQVREVKPNSGRCINPNQIANFRLKVPVTAGQVLEERLFQPLPVIRKGDRVLVVLKRGALTISTNAEAQGEAGVGQNVRVKFLDTNAELYVKASGPGQADM
jgi:flagella basal body P-ring formation protein FlgA